MPSSPLPIALLLDVDGTLLDLAPRPELVVVGGELVGLLSDLQAALDGALALVSGRAIDQLDALFAPLRCAAAGLHGVELRITPEGAITTREGPLPPPPLAEAARSLASDSPGAFIEDKQACIALHHRLPGDTRLPLRDALQNALDRYAPGWNLIDGHQVFELKPATIDKGSACRALLAEPAFRGRFPVYLGDDTTDVDAFVAVTALGGRSIAVGPRVAGHAQLALPTPADARVWLARLRAALSGDPGAVAAMLALPA